MELTTYFFDTYAFCEIIIGNPAYEKFKGVPLVTTRLNLMELYYGLLIKYGQSSAEKYYSEFLQYCITPDDESIKQAMVFRARNKRKKLSYIDCVGYVIALQKRMRFLTGDNGFKDLPNVEFIK